MNNKISKILLVLAVFGLLFSFASSAHAILAAVGKTNPATGFPRFYTDTNGVRLGLCTNPFFCPIDPTGVESFYFDAVVKSGRPPAPSATGIFAIEATYLNGAVVPGQEITFSRVRMRVRNLPVAGAYTIQHPWGTNTFNVTADAKGTFNINFTSDIGIAPRRFRGALAGPVGPWVRQIPSPGARFLGSAGATLPITPGPNGSAFTVTGPTGTVINETLWAISGQILRPARPAPTPAPTPAPAG